MHTNIHIWVCVSIYLYSCYAGKVYIYIHTYIYIYIYIHKGRTITITDVVSIVTKCAVSLANDLKVVDQGTLMQIMKISLYVRVHIKIIP